MAADDVTRNFEIQKFCPFYLAKSVTGPNYSLLTNRA